MDVFGRGLCVCDHDSRYVPVGIQLLCIGCGGRPSQGQLVGMGGRMEYMVCVPSGRWIGRRGNAAADFFGQLGRNDCGGWRDGQQHIWISTATAMDSTDCARQKTELFDL